ncbi:MAG: TolC family protein [Pseudomonadales bacterium]|jgi:outer membrane protein TolC|nr:TolC family protein [Pseudomonadales bacterium]
MSNRKGTWQLGVLLLAVAGQNVAAAMEHEHLAEVEGLDFATLLNAAMQQAPQILEAPVREQQASDYAAAGKRLLAGRPNVIYNLIDDRWRDNLGLRQQEFGLQLPLWRPGERRDAQAMGAHYEEQVGLWSTYLRWNLAGRLRSALMDLESAEAQLALEEAASLNAQALHRATERMFEAGSLARLDTMQTRNMLLQQQQKVLDADARMVDAERNFRVLTGLDRRPASAFTETRSAEDAVSATHPLLDYLNSEVTVARDHVQQMLLTNKGSPQLTIGTHSERGDRFQATTGSVLVQLSVPLGSKNVVNSQTSAARRLQVDAEVALRQNRIELQRLVHEAEHALFTIEQQLPLAEEQADLAEQRRAMAQGAFEAGELTLAQVLSSVQDAIAARQALSNMHLQRLRLISEYNQYLGVLP